VPTKIWKGPDVEELTIFTKGGCASEFEVGREYLVYAIRIDGRLLTNVCMRTQNINDAAEDLNRLGQPKVARISREHSLRTESVRRLFGSKLRVSDPRARYQGRSFHLRSRHLSRLISDRSGTLIDRIRRCEILTLRQRPV
jgi:hypothetical protein